MRIDIDKLTEEELIDLNHRIVERLRMIRELRAHGAMMNFRIGERVVFYPDPYRRLEAVITRYNRKTVTLLTDDGHRWNVGPSLLQKLETDEKNSSHVIEIARVT